VKEEPERVLEKMQVSRVDNGMNRPGGLFHEAVKALLA
jgi:hypothetical protein